MSLDSLTILMYQACSLNVTTVVLNFNRECDWVNRFSNLISDEGSDVLMLRNVHTAQGLTSHKQSFKRKTLVGYTLGGQTLKSCTSSRWVKVSTIAGIVLG